MKKKNKRFIITRDQYKKIKKMDHGQMSTFIESLLFDDNSREIGKFEESFILDMEKACDMTKGIGVKTKASFFENFNKIRGDEVRKYD